MRLLQADKQGSLLHPDGRALISLLPVTYSTPVDRELWVAALFTHDGKHVLGASASSKHHIHIWSNSGEPVAVLEGGGRAGMQKGSITHTSSGGSGLVWVCRRMRCLACTEPHRGFPHPLCSVVGHHDSCERTVLVTAVLCWAHIAAALLGPAGPKNDEILAMSWHPNRMMMVTVSSTGRVSGWRACNTG